MGVISKGGIRGEKKGPVVLASTVIYIIYSGIDALPVNCSLYLIVRRF